MARDANSHDLEQAAENCASGSSLPPRTTRRSFLRRRPHRRRSDEPTCRLPTAAGSPARRLFRQGGDRRGPNCVPCSSRAAKVQIPVKRGYARRSPPLPPCGSNRLGLGILVGAQAELPAPWAASPPSASHANPRPPVAPSSLGTQGQRQSRLKKVAPATHPPGEEPRVHAVLSSWDSHPGERCLRASTQAGPTIRVPPRPWIVSHPPFPLPTCRSRRRSTAAAASARSSGPPRPTSGGQPPRPKKQVPAAPRMSATRRRTPFRGRPIGRARSSA